MTGMANSRLLRLLNLIYPWENIINHASKIVSLKIQKIPFQNVTYEIGCPRCYSQLATRSAIRIRGNRSSGRVHGRARKTLLWEQRGTFRNRKEYAGAGAVLFNGIHPMLLRF